MLLFREEKQGRLITPQVRSLGCIKTKEGLQWGGAQSGRVFPQLEGCLGLITPCLRPPCFPPFFSLPLSLSLSLSVSLSFPRFFLSPSSPSLGPRLSVPLSPSPCSPALLQPLPAAPTPEPAAWRLQGWGGLAGRSAELPGASPNETTRGPRRPGQMRQPAVLGSELQGGTVCSDWCPCLPIVTVPLQLSETTSELGRPSLAPPGRQCWEGARVGRHRLSGVWP